MRIEPAALATALGTLDQIDLDRGLAPSVLQLVAMTKRLLDADGMGLMLVDAEGALRWAAASDQQAEQLEQAQEELAQGPAPTRSGSGRPCRSGMSPARVPRGSPRRCWAPASGRC
jgi:hypothetical protein